MADDDRAREEQRVREINQYIAENNALRAELDTAINNVHVLAGNVDSMSQQVVPAVTSLSSHTSTVDENVQVVRDALADLTRRYFLFKNLSTASRT